MGSNLIETDGEVVPEKESGQMERYENEIQSIRKRILILQFNRSSYKNVFFENIVIIKFVCLETGSNV